ncbi:TIGR02186 family protein [Pelagibacterium limicola]|uniref:TIGR02186 family protein n=1 Tax=Pelagibacterium limicola TaxID=2791022 RepID=UPI0018AF7CF6|nr:TIGR02186 family protein [Pelagibacterium limicola]
MALRLLAILALLIGAGQSVRGQDMVFSTSDRIVWIHSNFAGETITLFGNIEPDIAGERPRGSYDVVVLIRGPVGERVVRRKSRQFGVMLNADYALFTGLPSFYRVLSSRPLSTILDPDVLRERAFTVEARVSQALTNTTGNVPLFEGELIRLMQDASLFATAQRGVTFLSPTLFVTRVSLPANVPNGVFLAHALVVQDGQIVAERTQRFFVQKTGFERFLGEASRNQPLLYGLACVLLALVTGWLGGVLFRR